MKKFEYTVKDELGLHARPAGLLVKCISGFTCATTVAKGEKSADGKRLFAMMGLGVKCGDVLTFTLEGADEDAAVAAVKAFCESTL